MEDGQALPGSRLSKRLDLEVRASSGESDISMACTAAWPAGVRQSRFISPGAWFLIGMGYFPIDQGNRPCRLLPTVGMYAHHVDLALGQWRNPIPRQLC